MFTVQAFRGDLSEWKAPVLFIPVFQDEKRLPTRIAEMLAQHNVDLAGLMDASHFTAKLEEYRLYPVPVPNFPFLVLIGAGKISDWDMETARRLFGRVVKVAELLRMDQPAVYWDNELPIPKESAIFFPEVVAAMGTAAYRITEFKTEGEKEEEFHLSLAVLLYPGAGDELMQWVEEGNRLAACVNYARWLAEMPGNVLTPQRFVEEIRQLAQEYPQWKIKILDREDLEKEGMHALLAVAAGSQNPPYLAIIEYRPEGVSTAIGLVGKGVTFDSGGISIKPSKSMDEMKYDMSGAGAVLATMRLVAELKLPVYLIAALPLVENLPSGKASRPGDLVKSYSGLTIEILNTDAEGRLILADALSYLAKSYRPDIIVDLATLTGAIIVALGHMAAGLVTNRDDLAEEFREAGQISGERVWQLPAWDDYAELMKGTL
ncbi:MAG: leucyl aminopeptidase family protein, partial [Calditrichaeota bacterium]